METTRFLFLALLVLVALYVGVGFLDLPEETKKRVRSSIAGAALGIGAALLLALAATTLPAWAAWSAAGLAAAGSVGLLTGVLSVPSIGGGGGGGGSSDRRDCVFPDDCGRLVDGRICLDLSCPPA